MAVFRIKMKWSKLKRLIAESQSGNISFLKEFYLYRMTRKICHHLKIIKSKFTYSGNMFHCLKPNLKVVS